MGSGQICWLQTPVETFLSTTNCLFSLKSKFQTHAHTHTRPTARAKFQKVKRQLQVIKGLCFWSEMPARTKTAAPVAGRDSSASAVDSEIDAVSPTSENDSQEGESDQESDSDSLDSFAPRKRRRLSLDGDKAAQFDGDGQDEDSNSDDDEANVSKPPVVSFISAPSRIKKKNASSDAPTTTQRPATQPIATPTDDALAGTETTAPTDPNTTFESLGVHPWLVRSLTNMAIRRPTGIQKGCIPEILKGKDCIGGSRTGSGKTVAFAVPILQKWAEDPSAIFAVVLTPTRYVSPSP